MLKEIILNASFVFFYIKNKIQFKCSLSHFSQMRLPEHTKIQSGEREGENCEERVDPAHVQTENLSALEEVSTCIDKHF